MQSYANNIVTYRDTSRILRLQGILKGLGNRNEELKLRILAEIKDEWEVIHSKVVDHGKLK